LFVCKFTSMKKHFIAFFFPFLFNYSANAQSTNISGTINAYAAVTGFSCQTVNVSTTNGFSVGDRVLLIQLKGAIIDSTNTPSFGTILNYNGAGNYEMGTIQSIAGNSINLADSVLRQYNVNGAVQLVKVPVYGNVNVSAPLTCQAWNGITGGILAFQADSLVTLNADIDVSGKGYRGATLFNGSLVNCLGDTSNYRLPSGTASTAHKGEGIVNYNSTRADGKGANANGGGAGHDCNGGGAGGGNFGLGGYGGDSKCNVSCPPYFYQNSGGEAGKSLTYSNLVNKIYPGGGGGAGHQNNSGGSPGTNGGGIVLIITDSIEGNNHYIRSDGINNTLIANIDGQGGGGAGGTILFSCKGYNALHVSVQGGYGGVDNFSGSDCHGKGGGGGGGVIWTSAPVLSGMTKYLNGGLPGVFTAPGSYCYNGSNGASAGQPGISIIDLLIPESAAPCLTGIASYFESYSPEVYPNPADESISIKIKPSLLGSKFSIMDQMGRIVLTGKLHKELSNVNIDDLTGGAYILQVVNERSYYQKFIKR